MDEQYCARMLDFLVQLANQRRSFFFAFCVLNFVFSLVATLENLLVIRALTKASTIPATVNAVLSDVFRFVVIHKRGKSSHWDRLVSFRS